MVSSAARRHARRLGRANRQPRPVVTVQDVEEDLSERMNRLGWPLQTKIGNICFQRLDSASIRETLQSYHPDVTRLSKAALSQLVQLIQEDRVGWAISKVSEYRVNGNVIDETNLLEFIGRDYPLYTEMGVEFFLPLFRQLLTYDPNSQIIHQFGRYCEIAAFFREHQV